MLATAALALAACVDRGQVLGPGMPVVLQASPVRLALGQQHACAVVNGALSCWGLDDDGQLGTPPVTPGVGQAASSVPGTASWTVPAAGERHSCGLDASGRVWCWGANVEGQLGQGDQYPGQDQPLPVQVGTNRDWTFVATGQGHSCGIRAPGTLFCWGRNTDGELGQGGTQDVELRSPTQVGSDSDWVEVACGQNQTCARKANGHLFCWGAEVSGALGVGDVAEHDSPTEVPAISDWVLASTNTFHTCGLRTSGQIWCAGRDSEGQLGTPDRADATPNMQPADPNGGWVDVKTGRFFTCWRKGDGTVWCLGRNADDELNAGSSVPSSDLMIRAL